MVRTIIGVFAVVLGLLLAGMGGAAALLQAYGRLAPPVDNGAVLSLVIITLFLLGFGARWLTA